jgi:hypothetical protein
MELHDLPPLRVEPMRIRLKPGTIPIRQKLRKEPLAAKDFVHEQIMKLADGGIVRPSRSPWLQPIMVAAKKPPEMFRLCVDYRLVNEATITECMRMPSIDVLQHGLSGKPFITAIDLTSAYHQLPLHQDSVQVTAFGCSAGTFEYNRVPFGLRNAPFEFQRTLETLLAPLMHPLPPRPTCYVANYIYDVVIATTTFEEHLSVLEEFFNICLAKNLRVSIKKSAFGKKEVLYLGCDTLGHPHSCVPFCIFSLNPILPKSQSSLYAYQRFSVCAYGPNIVLIHPLTPTRQRPRRVFVVPSPST